MAAETTAAVNPVAMPGFFEAGGIFDVYVWPVIVMLAQSVLCSSAAGFRRLHSLR